MRFQITYMRKQITQLILLSVFLGGCGYTTRLYIHPETKKIHVQPFINKIDITTEVSEHRRLITYYPFLENKITQSVIEHFIRDGNLRITKQGEADYILEGELIDFRRDVLRYTEDNIPKEYRLSLVVNLSLWTENKEKVLWQEKDFFGDTTYFVTGSLAKSESLAIDDAIEDLARRIVGRTDEVW